jgi:uncharacterized repeat protein (TIGR03803 family)
MLVRFFLVLTLVARAQAQSIEILHDFGVTTTDGNGVPSPLLKDASGNLYGTTSAGGAHNLGTVYRLSPISTGGFKETILYSFKGGSADGASPQGPLVRDSVGNLYGVTLEGGVAATVCNVETPSPGCGVIFKLSPAASGAWVETVLHRFTGIDGGNPWCGLVRDSKGNFYGATPVGGSAGLGTVYKLSLTSTGWKETVLHSFAGNSDGASPFMFETALTLDGFGNVYGSTMQGGAANAGIVFRLVPQAPDVWTEEILYAFKGGSDGSQPATGVILDKTGNVYGTTWLGGTHIGSGTVFELMAAKGYTKSVLHNFNVLTDPAKSTPHTLLFDASGNLFGTTEEALYKLTHESSGWTESLIWAFDNSQDQGANTVYAPAVMDSQRNFWGTTLWGGLAGPNNGGTAWKIVP